MDDALHNDIRSAVGMTGQPHDDEAHSRYTVRTAHMDDARRTLVHNIPFLFTCDAHEKLTLKQHHSIIIDGDTITDVVPADTVAPETFDVVYDAGKRGGVVVTPGFVNTHAHSHMYLLRSAMMLDEEMTVDDTIKAMGMWQRDETPESYTYATIGDITEQQKVGITTTLTHGPHFDSGEIAARLSGQNIVNAVSAVSNSRPENNPEMVEQLFAQRDAYVTTPAIALHYLWKTPMDTLREVKRIADRYDALVTFHMAESPLVVEETLKKHAMSETEILEHVGMLNERSIASHVLYVKDEEIVKLAHAGVGIAHLPTSNAIHKSGTFAFWKFADADGFAHISLGTDSVVSKNRLDILTEAYQARVTHLYSRTIKFGSLFKMMTSNGARVVGMHDRGKIIPGMKADIVFWKLRDRGFIPYDHDNPFTLIGNLITHGGRMARDVMIGGRFVIVNRKHIRVNESHLLEILQQKHMDMRKRVQDENGVI